MGPKNHRKGKLPPFGREIRGRARNLWVFAGVGAWDCARSWGPGERLVLPDGEEPSTFHWPVSGAGITVRAPGLTAVQIERLAAILIGKGAALVVVLPDVELQGRGFRVIRPGGSWRPSHV